MELSKEYFSSKTYAFRGGKYLDYNTLDASADNSGLLGRTSKKNANGLNPAVGDVFPTDDGDKKITANDVLLLDIFEYDWYQNKELKGCHWRSYSMIKSVRNQRRQPSTAIK